MWVFFIYHYRISLFFIFVPSFFLKKKEHSKKQKRAYSLFHIVTSFIFGKSLLFVPGIYRNKCKKNENSSVPISRRTLNNCSVTCRLNSWKESFSDNRKWKPCIIWSLGPIKQQDCLHLGSAYGKYEKSALVIDRQLPVDIYRHILFYCASQILHYFTRPSTSKRNMTFIIWNIIKYF